MSWVPQAQRPYYNPTTNRIPLSILGNHQRAALDDADEKDFEGIDTARYDDSVTPWLTIAPKPVTVPILELQEMTIAERAEKARQARAQRKKRRKLE